MSFRRDDPIEQADRGDFRKRYAATDKIAVHRSFELILDQLEDLKRGPDAWEEACLVHALSYMEAGLYDRARTAGTTGY